MFLKNTIKREKNSVTFKIMSKLLNGNKVGRQLWYMEDIFKDNGRCDVYSPKLAIVAKVSLTTAIFFLLGLEV